MSEKRNHPRTPLNLTLTATLRDGASFEGVARDISLGGMFVEASTIPAFGAELTLEASFPGEKAPVRLPCIVRWSKTNGFGVQFGLLGARETHLITQIIRRAP